MRNKHGQSKFPSGRTTPNSRTGDRRRSRHALASIFPAPAEEKLCVACGWVEAAEGSWLCAHCRAKTAARHEGLDGIHPRNAPR